MTTSWTSEAAEALLARLGTDVARGLSSAEAARRRRLDGPNDIAAERGRTALAIVGGQLTDATVLLLIVAAVVSGSLGDRTDTLAILAIVIMNALVGFSQEYRAERAVEALRGLTAARAKVVRNGSIDAISERDVVRGDIVMLEAGDAVPADMRLLEAAAMRVDESILTGESHPVDKAVGTLAGAVRALHERTNAVFKGTFVTAGRAVGVAVETGMSTEVGAIAALLARTERRRTPLQERLAAFGRQLTVAAVGVCAVVFVAGVARGEPVLLMFLTAVSLAVAAVPEALPIVVNVALALGAQRLARHHVLVRRLASVETLGAVTTICTDKTGTLTENRLTAVAFVTNAGRRNDVPPQIAALEPWRTLLWSAALNNDVALDARGTAVGDPTEVALEEAARAAGLHKMQLAARAERIAELPFDAERKRMTTVHRHADGTITAIVKGAPETVLERCAYALEANGVTPADRKALREEAERLASAGLRVLVFATRAVERGACADEALEHDLTFVGMVGLVDPLRPEVAGAVEDCRSAGIVPVMITGDHPLTAARIASQLGIFGAGDAVMTGRELASFDPKAWPQTLRNVRVYARVDPSQKLRIVEALQRLGETVAMTGDGVNDAPALKRADVGVAMGRSGTDVAREAAHVVLTDDNFASIVAGVRQGRRIFDNIRAFTKYVLSGNLAEIATVLLPPLMGLPLALLPIQILWVNLITDALPALALAAEPAQPDVMTSPPRRRDEAILSRGAIIYVVSVGGATAAASIGMQVGALAHGLPYWQTMTFTVLTLAQVFQALAASPGGQPAFGRRIFNSPALLSAVAFTCALQAAAIYLPLANALLHTTPLPPLELGLCALAAASVFVAIEAAKTLARLHSPNTTAAAT